MDVWILYSEPLLSSTLSSRSSRIDPGIAQCVADHWWEMLDGKDAEEKQPEVDLNANIEMEWDSFNKHVTEYGDEVVWLNWLSLVDIANYFYELGKQSGSSEIPNDLEEAKEAYCEEHNDDCFDATGDKCPHIRNAFIAGAKWQKSQMLKDAVEGYVNYYEDSGGILMAEAQVGSPYHNGDKVRIIIVKEEENK